MGERVGFRVDIVAWRPSVHWVGLDTFIYALFWHYFRAILAAVALVAVVAVDCVNHEVSIEKCTYLGT